MKAYHIVLLLLYLCRDHYEHVKFATKQVFEAQIFAVNRKRSYFSPLSLLDMKL